MNRIEFAKTPVPKDLAAHMKEVEREILIDALTGSGWNRTRAGMAMGLTLRQMRYRMSMLGISYANEITTENCHPT